MADNDSQSGSRGSHPSSVGNGSGSGGSSSSDEDGGYAGAQGMGRRQFGSDGAQKPWGEATDADVPQVDVETLMALPDHERHLLVQRRFDAIRQNRRLREDGRDDHGLTLKMYTSNFKQVMRTLENEDGRGRRGLTGAALKNMMKRKAKGRSGADPDGPTLGPLMAEIKRMEDEEKDAKRKKLRAAIDNAHKQQRDQNAVSLGDNDDDDGLGGNGAMVGNILDYVDEEDIEKAVTMPKDVKEHTKAMVSTAKKAEEMTVLEERDEKLKALAAQFDFHLKRVRPRLYRTRSAPGAYKSMATFELLTQQVEEQKHKIRYLQDQADGVTARPREKLLEKQIKTLDEQISNQISLIRGLREKLRMMKEQHQHCMVNQRQINAAITNAYMAGVEMGMQRGATAGSGGSRGMLLGGYGSAGHFASVPSTPANMNMMLTSALQPLPMGGPTDGGMRSSAIVSPRMSTTGGLGPQRKSSLTISNKPRRSLSELISNNTATNEDTNNSPRTLNGGGGTVIDQPTGDQTPKTPAADVPTSPQAANGNASLRNGSIVAGASTSLMATEADKGASTGTSVTILGGDKEGTLAASMTDGKKPPKGLSSVTASPVTAAASPTSTTNTARKTSSVADKLDPSALNSPSVVAGSVAAGSSARLRAAAAGAKAAANHVPNATALPAMLGITKPTAAAGNKSARVFEGRNQLVDEGGKTLPQGRHAAAVVISAHSLAHLHVVMPDVVEGEIAVLREVLKPSGGDDGANSRAGTRSGVGAGSLSPAAGALKKSRGRGLPTGSIQEQHPFTTCKGVEAARYCADVNERFLFIFPSATDAVKYCMLTQQRLLDASWNPSLGDEYECGSELVQGTTTEFVWRGLRVSMGIELGPTIRTEVLLADLNAPALNIRTLISRGGIPATPMMGGTLVGGFGSPPPSAPGGSHASQGAYPQQQQQLATAVSHPAAHAPASEEDAEGIAMAEHLFAANSPVVSVPYEGPATDTAAYLCNIAVGGEILLTKPVADACDLDSIAEALQGYFQHKYLINLGAVSCPFADFTPQLQYFGDINHHVSKAAVFRVLCPTLVAREPLFRRDLPNAERSYATHHATAARGPFDDVPPPSVVPTINSRAIAVLGLVITDWNVVPQYCSMSTAAAVKTMIFSAIREVSTSCRGYVSRVYNKCETYIIVFDEVLNACSFGVKIHDYLMGLEWPDEVLMIPQFGRVEIDKKLLFNGPRVQCGVIAVTPGKRSSGAPAAFTYSDALTGRTLYAGGGTELASLVTQQACGGELLVNMDVIPTVTKHHEFLGFAIQNHCVDMCSNTSETLIELYQVFSRRRALCASYVNRESRLRSEDDAAIDSKAVRMYEEQIATLKEKLFNKDQSIKRLDNLIGEKNSVIAEIRSEVMKHAHYRYSLQDTLDQMAVASTRSSFEAVLVGISFAHADVLFQKFPAEAAQAAKLYGTLVEKLAAECQGKLVCRLPSGISRIYQFIEAAKAVEFWFKVYERALGLEWPPRLEETSQAGLLRAIDIVENLHPNLDQLIWKGLRPICAMDYGIPASQFDGISRTYVPHGPEIDYIGEMLSAAAEGDCIVSFNCSIIVQKTIVQRFPNARLLPYGPNGSDRLTTLDSRLRLKALRTVFPADLMNITFQSRSVHKCLSVFVSITDFSNLEDRFTSDVVVFQRCVEKLLQEYGGTMIGCDGKGHRYSIVFPDVDNGIDFMSTIHSVLMHCSWSAALLREPEFADRIHENRQITGGITAKVGAHLLFDVLISVQKFGGQAMYKHAELGFAVVLAHHAHGGETLVTEEVFAELMQSTKERSAKIYPDLIGALAVDGVRGHPLHVYQILPMELHFRSALFLEEDRINNDPEERRRRKAQSNRQASKRKQYFDAYQIDEAMLRTCERTLNPIDDPVRLNQRLYTHIKAAMDEDRHRFITSQRTLQMLETISMLTEDRASLPPSARGYPFHVHLVLHVMEHAFMCKDPIFNKKYAVELLSDDMGDEDDEDGDGRGGSTSVTGLLSHVSGVGVGNSKALLNSGAGGGGGGGFGVETHRTRMERMQGQRVMPEDLVQLHVDVERFVNIIDLHGVSKEAGKQWVSCFPDLCMAGGGPDTTPDKDKEGKDSSKQLRLLSSMKSSIGMSIDEVDVETIRNSVVANLSHILYQMLYVGKTVAAGDE